MGTPEYHPDFPRVTAQVEKATHEFYFQPDWELNLAIIDEINMKEDVYVF